EYGSENSRDNPELIECHASSAKPRGSNLSDIVWGNHRCCPNAKAANQPPENKLAEICSKEHAQRGETETESAQGEALFFAKIVGNGSRRHAASNAADECASSGPAHATGVQVKQLAQKANRTTDHNVVVAE